MDYISRLYSYNVKTENIYLEKVTIPGPGSRYFSTKMYVKCKNAKYQTVNNGCERGLLWYLSLDRAKSDDMLYSFFFHYTNQNIHFYNKVV